MKLRGAFAAVVVALTAIASEASADPVESADDPSACVHAADRGQRARKDGKLQDARDLLLSCAAPVCPESVQKDCLHWANDVIDLLPSIVIDATDDEGHDIGDARVIIDDYEVATVTEGRSISLDPGPHTIRVERQGYVGVSQKIIAKEGMHARRIPAVLVGAHVDPWTAARSGTPVASSPSTEDRVTPSRPPTWTFGAMAIGAATMTAGILILANSSDRAESSERDVARGLAYGSIVLGGAAIVTGLFGYFSEPAKPKPRAAGITITPAGAFGRF